MGMELIKETLAVIALVALTFIIRELFPSEDSNQHLAIWGLAVASGVASLASGIFQGAAQSEAAKQRNKQKINDWIHGEMQKGLQNGQQLFQASRAMGEQAKKNLQIQRTAYAYKEEARDRIKEDISMQHQQLNIALQASQAAVVSSAASRNIQGGTAKRLQFGNLVAALNNAQTIERNESRSFADIETQTNNILSQQTQNFIQANFIGSSNMPGLESESAGMAGGVLGGIAGGLSAAGGFYAGAGK